MSNELGDKCLGDMALVCAIQGYNLPITLLDTLRSCVYENSDTEASDWFKTAARNQVRAVKAETENVLLREAIKPFAKWENRDFDQKKAEIGILYQRGANGEYCLPDSHGYECVWVDEEDGGIVELTAGQFRRARAAFASSEGPR